MSGLTSTISNAVMLSALYALVAIGFTLIFGVGGVLNLSHGATITVGAFTAYFATSVFGLNIWAAAFASMVVGAAFMIAFYLGMVQFVEDQPITVMILTLVMSIVVEEVAKILVGTQPRALPSLVDGQIALLGGVQANRLLAFALSWVIIALLFAGVNYTRTGKAILATSMSTKGASLVGIESKRMYLYTWALAGLLAALAGVFLGSIQTVSWAMGREPLVLSFSIVVLGGIGSIRGSILGAYVIGFLEVFTVSYVDSSLSGLASLVVLVIILLVKPEGLFGRELTH
ncbi:branched-chain amino acid ABC transporter permease [Halocalculus aciditolerans]|uniref:Branched-chain amino acid ABC transporter permease n=1 Tax=Halocalculus aciditolerans TaxID=1383812 RepID=A0A830F0A6_9EURY|nr:branched-chain amino acid ABC transporter permease [Halocalculus aciditolerans]GGL48427.1 branched-chain amino acid ABC transporter permease [Halocalculus aciditolerans]